MKNIMEYNGYTGIVEYSGADRVFFGKVFGINDLITFEGDSVKQLEKAFRDAVDDYVETCGEQGKEPERAYKGSFNVRIDPEVHRKAAFKAQTLHISLNEFVEQAIEKEVNREDVVGQRRHALSAGRRKGK
jgi:predicted HicB family RNase H-like nuclease